MHPDLARQIANERAERLRRRAAERARVHARTIGAVTPPADLVIRTARHSDTGAVSALAALDGTLPPIGPALVAEVEGTILAVLPLDGGRPFADPFRHTADLVALLEARALQIEETLRDRRDGSRRSRLAWLAPEALRRLV